MKEKKKMYGYIMLLILMLGTALHYYSSLIFTVRIDTLEVFHMNPVQLATISTVGGIPGAVFSVYIGNLLDRRGIRMFVGGATALAVGCMAARVFMTSYMGLMLTTVLIGMFLLPIIIVGPKMLGGLFEPEHIPFAMGCYGAAGGMGTTLAFATGPVYESVQAALAGVTVIGAVTLALWLVFCRADSVKKEEQPGTQAPKGAFAKVLKSPNMWKTMICGGCAVGASLIVNTSLVYGFMERGFDAGLLGTVLNICLILGGILSGMVLGRIGKFNMPYLFICVCGGFLFLLGWLVTPGVLSYVLYALAGLIASASVGVNFTRIPLLYMTGDFGIEMTGAASGMLQTALGIFQFVVPTAAAGIAVTADGGTNYTMKFVLAFALLVAAGFLGLTIPELGVKGKLAQEAAKH